MSAHFSTVLRRINYTAPGVSGLIMKYSPTGESGIVMLAQSPFLKTRYSKNISRRGILENLKNTLKHL